MKCPQVGSYSECLVPKRECSLQGCGNLGSWGWNRGSKPQGLRFEGDPATLPFLTLLSIHHQGKKALLTSSAGWSASRSQTKFLEAIQKLDFRPFEILGQIFLTQE